MTNRSLFFDGFFSNRPFFLLPSGAEEFSTRRTDLLGTFLQGKESLNISVRNITTTNVIRDQLRSSTTTSGTTTQHNDMIG